MLQLLIIFLGLIICQFLPSCFSHKMHFKSGPDLILYHLKKRSGMEIEDCYKLLYQGILGPKHLLAANPVHVKEYLWREFAEASASGDEEIFEPVATDGSLVRINLRPFKQAKGDVEKLFQALVITSEKFPGSTEKFSKSWQEFKAAVESNAFRFDKLKLQQFDQKIVQENYPDIHHSENYKKAYRPAYRVVASELLPRLFVDRDS